jgi:opacity protein-like surface antigen
LQLRPRWSLQPGLGLQLFTEPGPRTFDTTFTAQTNALVETRLKQRLYLEAPVTLHYHFHRRFSAYAGLSVGYLLTTYAAQRTTAYQGGNIEETNREVFGQRRLAHDWQIGAIAGLRWQLTPRWQADLRYFLGNRPGQTQGPAGELQALPRQQYLQLGVGYRLFRFERIKTR